MGPDDVDSRAGLGTLILAVTPLDAGFQGAYGPGSLPGDVSPGGAGSVSAHLLEVLASADIVAADDPERVRAFAREFGLHLAGELVAAPVRGGATIDGTGVDLEAILAPLRGGDTVLACADPEPTDATARLVRYAADCGARITCLPGPSPVTTALVLSGLPSDRFCSDGAAPRDAAARRDWLAALASEDRTCVFTTDPATWQPVRADAVELLGQDRPVAAFPTRPDGALPAGTGIGEIARGTLGDLPEAVDEAAIVVLGPASRRALEPSELVSRVTCRVDSGERLKDAVAVVAAEAGVRKNELYEAVLEARKDSD